MDLKRDKQPPETAINECHHGGWGGPTTPWDAYLPAQTIVVSEPRHVNI